MKLKRTPRYNLLILKIERLLDTLSQRDYAHFVEVLTPEIAALRRMAPNNKQVDNVSGVPQITGNVSLTLLSGREKNVPTRRNVQSSALPQSRTPSYAHRHSQLYSSTYTRREQSIQHIPTQRG